MAERPLNKSQSSQVRPEAQRKPMRMSGNWLTRTLAFCFKEMNEIRRQPLLLLSLIAGPMLVLIIFGASYQNSNPVLRTALVLPPGGIPGIDNQRIAALVGANFQVVEISEDEAGVRERLAADQLDVVQIFPQVDPETVGQRTQIEFVSNAVNPLNEGWIQYLAYAEVNEINRELLKQQTRSAQQEALGMRGEVSEMRVQLGDLEGRMSREDLDNMQRDVRQLQRTLAALEVALPPDTLLAEDFRDLRERIDRLQVALDEIDQAISDGEVDRQIDKIRSARDDLGRLEGVIEVFVATDPDMIVSPVQRVYNNIRGGAYPAVVFYSPGILALLIQHTAVSLAALALVRERLLGTLEIFRVAPVSVSQLLVGKYLGYTLFIVVMAGILMGLMSLLGVPLPVDIPLFAGLIVLLILASLGIGFVISAVSSTDSQAVQLSMIVLLLSIFFSGLFIALDSFAPIALAVSTVLPMTHGVSGFQDLMLRQVAPDLWAWGSLALIAVVAFVAAILITKRQYRQA